MSWAQSLIRIREFEIDTLRKRMGEIVQKRAMVEAILAALDEEAEAETRHARTSAEAAWYLPKFRAGWKGRRAKVEGELQVIAQEERGCRDALADAYTELKKIEQVADKHRADAAKVAARREQAALDEIALRMMG